MSEIKIKITADTSELKEGVAESSKLVKRLESGHKASTKKRVKLEMDSYAKIDKTRNKSTKKTVDSNKLLERENKDRLKKEVNDEKRAVAEKMAARARLKSMALQGGSQALGGMGLGSLGAGIGLMGAGGLLGLGLGVAIAGLISVVKLFSELFAYKSKLSDFKVEARLTSEEILKMEDGLDDAATTAGTTSPKLLEAAMAYKEATGILLDPSQYVELANAQKAAGQSTSEMESTFSKLRSRGVPLKDILDTYTLMGSKGGNVTAMTKALDGQFKNLDLTNKDNVRTMRELMFLFKTDDLDEWEKKLEEIRKKSRGKNGNNPILEIYKVSKRGKLGKDLNSMDSLIKSLTKLQQSGDLPEWLQGTDLGKLSTKSVKEEQGLTLYNRRQDSGEAMERIKQLLFVFAKDTVFQGLQSALNRVADWLSDPDNIDAMVKFLKVIADSTMAMARFFGLAETPVDQKKLQESETAGGRGPDFRPGTAREAALKQGKIADLDVLLPGLIKAIEDSKTVKLEVVGNIKSVEQLSNTGGSTLLYSE